jgi:hypothetical protein
MNQSEAGFCETNPNPPWKYTNIIGVSDIT